MPDPTTFLVMLSRSGPNWVPDLPAEQQSDWAPHASFMDRLVDDGVVILGGPVGTDGTVAMAMLAESEPAVRAILERDPWSGSHLLVMSITPWHIRLRAPRLVD